MDARASVRQVTHDTVYDGRRPYNDLRALQSAGALRGTTFSATTVLHDLSQGVANHIDAREYRKQ